jgi:hypothetical protein
MSDKKSQAVQAVCGVAFLAGVGWVSGMTLNEAKALGVAMLGLTVTALLFNRGVRLLVKLPFSDATKGTIAIVAGIGALSICLTSCSTKPTYLQAEEIAHEQASELSFLDVGSRSDCSDDCSGHEAGFEWAKENGVTETWDCPSSGNLSFAEGCDAFAMYVSGTMDELD